MNIRTPFASIIRRRSQQRATHASPLRVRSFGIMIATALWATQASPLLAQCPGCQINFGCTVAPAYPTLCPLQPANATSGQPYSADITFWMPVNFDDPGTGFNVDFLQMTITGVTGLPFGLEIETNDPLGIYYPQQNQFGCARICGTPLGAGTFTVTISIIAQVEYSGFIINAPQQFPITLVVLPGSGGNSGFSFTPTNGCGSAEVQFTALIDGAPDPTTYAWDFGNGNTGSDALPPAQTYGSPGTYTVSLQTTIGGYVLDVVTLSGVNDNWCGDVEEPDIFGCTGSPDLYFVLTDGGGGTYTSSSGSDSGSETWTGLGLVLNNPPYSIAFYDEDPISQDDILGTLNIPIGTVGNLPFNIAGGTFGSIDISLQTQQLFNDTDTVVVYPVPEIVLAYDTAAAEICAGDTTLVSYTWYNNGDTVPMANGPCVNANAPGLWWSTGTNGFGCFGVSDTVVVCPSLAIYYDAGVLFVDDVFDAYAWTFDGVTLPNNDQPFAFSQGDGLYAITGTTAYGCVVTDTFTLSTLGIAAVEPTTPTLLVYPVPNDGNFMVQARGLTSSQVMLRVLDTSGKEVFAERCSLVAGSISVRVGLRGTTIGRYLVLVEDGTERHLTRAIVVTN
ncbi:MAG: PKD domain-containing protein [Flavobacteriales bacterium]|nr:PKD domain-containing protein [Flavobacteriales bacterium]